MISLSLSLSLSKMSNAGVTIFDGAVLRSTDLNLPELEHGVTGAQLLEISESKVSESLSGLSLPPHIKDAAMSRVSAGDGVSFRITEFNREQASEKLGVFVSAVADALTGNRIIPSPLHAIVFQRLNSLRKSYLVK